MVLCPIGENLQREGTGNGCTPPLGAKFWIGRLVSQDLLIGSKVTQLQCSHHPPVMIAALL